MPRLFIRHKQADTEERQRRNRRFNIFRADAWIDPFPNVIGTLPEKMIYAELSRRRIPFVFQSFWRFTIPEFNFDKWYRPDFVIPGAKIILEVQGVYWHSKPEQIEQDAFKFAVYEQLGWRVVSWWDSDILTRLGELIASEPSLLRLEGQGGRIFTGNEKQIDDSAGIRTANQARTDYGQRQADYASVRKSKSIYSYGVV